MDPTLSNQGSLVEDLTSEITDFVTEAERLRIGIIDSHPERTFDKLFGLYKAKEILKENVVLPFKFPQLFTRHWCRKLLLFGAPGTGKTLLAKSLKSFLPQVNVLHVHTWNFLSKYIGDGEKRIKETFEFARKHQPSILILEDLDAMSDARNEGSSDRIRRLKTEMLVQLSSTNNHRDDTLTIIGITNRPKDINKAVLKRFIKCIYFPLPEEFTRKDLLKERFGSFAYELTDSEFDELVTRTEGYTGSDLEVLSRDIAMVPLRDMMNATHFYIRPDGKYHPCLPTKEGSTEMSLLSLKSEECYVRPVTWQDVRNCLSRSKPSVNQEEMQDYMDFVILKGLEDQLNGSANQPMSLMKLAKISIKSPLISNNQMKNIHQLPLPKRLQDYLLTH